MPRIVFVCTGNQCRSPMAEGLLRHRLKQEGREDILVSSMGVHGPDGRPASENAVEVCREAGIDISGHRSRPLIPEEMVESDIIFVMEPVHREFIQTFFPKVGDRVFLLKSWPNPDRRRDAIKDPVLQSAKVYKKVFIELGAQVDRIVPELLDMFPGK